MNVYLITVCVIIKDFIYEFFYTRRVLLLQLKNTGWIVYISKLIHISLNLKKSC